MDVFIKDYGVNPDTDVVLHKTIQKAIDDCSNSGGGTVYFETGTYRIGTIYLKDNVYLNLPPRCVLKGSDSFDDYNKADDWPQNASCIPEFASGAHLIVGLEVKNCGIFGGGIIDGNGKHFGYKIEEGFVRPSQMVYFCECENVRLQNLELLNSTYWTCFIHGCDKVFISGIRIKNNPEISNGDGIDIDSSSKVVVSDCIIDSQDDCLTFRNNASRLKNNTKILEDITVTNCQFKTAGCNAMRIGVGNGKIRNCLVSNIVIRDSSKGVCLESRYNFNTDEKPGTVIENISFDNIYVDAKLPFFIASYSYGIFDLVSPDIRNIRFNNVTSISDHNVVIQCFENSVLENVSFSNCDFSFRGVPVCVDKYGYSEWDYKTSSAGFYVANANNVRFNNVQVHIEDENSPIDKGIISVNSQVKYLQFSAEKAGKIIEEKGTIN